MADRIAEALDLARYALRRIADPGPLAGDRDDPVAELTARRRYALDIWTQICDMTGGDTGRGDG